MNPSTPPNNSDTSDDVNQDLLDRKFTRLFLWIGAVMYPLWGWITQMVEPTANDSFLKRFPATIFVLLLLIPAYSKQASTKTLRKILLLVAVGLTFHFFYIASHNTLDILYSCGLLVHLIGTCSALISAAEVIAYIVATSSTLTWMIATSRLTFDPGFIFSLITLYLYFFLGAFYRIDLLNRMKQSQLSNLASQSTALQVAHDMRAPVATLSFLKTKAKDNSFDPDDQKLYGMALERLSRISGELLNQFHRISQNKKSEIDVGKTLIQLIQEARARSPNVVFHYSNIYSDLMIDGNLNHFERGVSNILNNAIESFNKVTNKEKPEVFVAVKSSSKKSDFVIEFKDNGRGIPPEVLKKLLKTTVTHGKEGGTGIGLFTSQKLLEQLNFKLSIESKVDHGTTIYLKRKSSILENLFK